MESGVWGGSLSPPRGCWGTFQLSAAGLCCLPDSLAAAILAVADVVGMEGLSATALSEARSAPEPSDCASEPHKR